MKVASAPPGHGQHAGDQAAGPARPGRTRIRWRATSTPSSGGEQHQRCGDAVEAEVEAHAEGRHPGQVDVEPQLCAPSWPAASGDRGQRRQGEQADQRSPRWPRPRRMSRGRPNSSRGPGQRHQDQGRQQDAEPGRARRPASREHHPGEPDHDGARAPARPRSRWPGRSAARRSGRPPNRASARRAAHVGVDHVAVAGARPPGPAPAPGGPPARAGPRPGRNPSRSRARGRPAARRRCRGRPAAGADSAHPSPASAEHRAGDGGDQVTCRPDSSRAGGRISTRPRATAGTAST